MSQTYRIWAPSVNFPAYEVSEELEEIRKIGDDYKFRLPRFWGQLDNTEPEWLVTLRDEEGDTVTVPVYDVTHNTGWPEGKFDN